jgi:hypothetical protein
LLETKVKVVEIAVPALFCALAVNNKVAPTCREALRLGLRVIFAGNGEAPGGLLPPQAANNTTKTMVTTAHTRAPKRELPMHPLVASRLKPIG